MQEWADYTSDVLPWLEEDRELDAASYHPGQHHFEKMTSGLYMGDLARRIILRCVGVFQRAVARAKAITTPASALQEPPVLCTFEPHGCE